MSYENRGNVHISYNLATKPYHKVVAKLVEQNIQSKDAKILDVGCGLGHTSSEVLKLLPHISLTLSDIDAECLSIAKERLNVSNDLHITDISDLFDIEEKFDIVILSHVLEHLDNPVSSLNGLLNVLAPNGRLIVAVPNAVTPSTILKSFTRTNYVNHGHVCTWDRSHWEIFIQKRINAEIVELTGDIMPFPYIWDKKPFFKIQRAMLTLFPWFSLSNIAILKNHN